MNLMGLTGVFLWFIVICIAAPGLVVGGVACLLRKWKLAVWAFGATFAAIVAGAIASCLIVSFIWRPYDPTSEADLKEAYRADFEVLPPSGITVVRARQIVVGDAGGQWLLLKASPEEIERHIGKGFIPTQRVPEEFGEKPGPNAPAWWKPPPNRLRYYENRHWTKSGGWSDSRATMGVDASAGLIWFVASKMN